MLSAVFTFPKNSFVLCGKRATCRILPKDSNGIYCWSMFVWPMHKSHSWLCLFLSNYTNNMVQKVLIKFQWNSHLVNKNTLSNNRLSKIICEFMHLIKCCHTNSSSVAKSNLFHSLIHYFKIYSSHQKSRNTFVFMDSVLI